MTETQPAESYASDTPTEHTSLLENDIAGASQPVAPVTNQTWLGLPIYLLVPALIFLLGSSADYFDGSIFSTGIISIGALYKQQNNAAFITIVYNTIFAVFQPLYSVAWRRFNWTILMTVAFIVFALGQLLASLSEPPNRNQTPLKTEFSILLPLLGARAVTAAGACAMVYLPNLFFNKVVSSGDRAIWEAIQAAFAFVAQFFGRKVGGEGFADGRQLRNCFQWQLPSPLLCAGGLWLWSWQRRPSGNRTGYEPCLSVSTESSTATALPAAISIVSLSLAIASFCISLNIFAMTSLQRAGKWDYSFPVLTSISFSVGIVFLVILVWEERHLRRVAPAAALFPWALTLAVRKRLGLILVSAFVQSAIISSVIFVLPWYSQGSETSNTWLFRFLDIGTLAGSIFTGIVLKRWTCCNSPLLYPKTALYTGTALSLLAALCMFGNWTWLRLKRLSYIVNAAFGFGNGVVSATLLPCVLQELGEQTERYQAMMYASLHLAGNLAGTVITAICNVAMQELAEHRMRAAKISEEDIQSCLIDLKSCLDQLNFDSKIKVQAVFIKTSSSFINFIGLLNVILLLMIVLFKNYKF